MNIAAIILAAGSSSRMGQSKQMLEVNGEKLLEKTVTTVLASQIREVVVVLGADAEQHSKVLTPFAVSIVFNDQWKKGMGSSIKAGLRYITSTGSSCDAVIIFVCDQPMLMPDTVSSIVQRFEQTNKPVVASGYSNVPGVPVLFAKSYFPKLEQLPDDHGAKRIIQQNPSDAVIVPFPGGEIDLDTMEDYKAFLQNRS